MQKEYFKCYELFHKIGKELPSELQGKYYIALMEYGLYGIIPDDPVIKSLLQGPMYSIQRTEEIRTKQSNGGKKHIGNQYTKGDTKRQAQKKQVEVSGSIVEDNGTEWKKEDIEDNRRYIKKENIKEKKIEKKKYLEFVELTDEEYNKLLNIFGKDRLDKEIQKLNNYIGSSGKKYKSHYFTIRQWNQEVIQELEKRKKELETLKQDLPSEGLLGTIQLKR